MTTPGITAALATSLLLVATLASGTPILDEAPYHAWTTQTLDDDIVLGPASLAFDPQGNPTIGYDVFGNGMWLAERDNGLWTKTKIAIGIVPTIAFEPDGTLHIAYVGQTGIEYMQRQANTWTTETIDANGGFRPQLDLDATGRVHAVYKDYHAPSHTYHAVRDTSGTWTKLRVDTQTSTYPKMDTEPDGTTHIVFIGRNDAEPTFRYITSNGTHVLTNELVPGCWNYPSVAVDSQGQAHVLCLGLGGARYQVRDTTGTWTHTSVTNGRNLIPERSPGDTGWQTSITVDGNDVPHVSFMTRPSGAVPSYLYYGVADAGAWHVETVDVAGWKTGTESDITIDPRGQPAIASVQWRLQQDEIPCSHVANRCFDLRYHQPVVPWITGHGNTLS